VYTGIIEAHRTAIETTEDLDPVTQVVAGVVVAGVGFEPT
jgi:hypothetical protein